jgi:hypothetical protein
LTPEQIHELISIIEQHGLSLVALIVLVVFVLWPWVKGWKQRAEKAAETNETISADNLELSIAAEVEIMNILAMVASSLGAQWAVLWQFHNGIVTSAEIPFMKLSVTNEFAEEGKNLRGSNYQGIPISVFLDAVMEVKDKTFIKVCLDSQYKSIVNSYKGDGVECGYLFRVNGIRGAMVGILSVSFDKPFELTIEKIEEAKGMSARLSMVLARLSSSLLKYHRRSDDK